MSINKLNKLKIQMPRLSGLLRWCSQWRTRSSKG
jgi:hypothetical protein